MTARQPRGCPDCTATVIDNHLEHDSSCPVGRAEDERQARDRIWFENHPRAQRFVRPIFPSEVIELRLAGHIFPGWSAAGTIEGTQIAPGVRTRSFSGLWIHPVREGAA